MEVMGDPLLGKEGRIGQEMKKNLVPEQRSSYQNPPLFTDASEDSQDGLHQVFHIGTLTSSRPSSRAGSPDRGSRIDDLVPDYYSITLDRLSRGGTPRREAEPEPEFARIKLRKTPSRENLSHEEPNNISLRKTQMIKNSLRKTASLYNLEVIGKTGSRSGSPAREMDGKGMPPINRLTAARPGWSRSGSRAGSRVGSRAASPEKGDLDSQGKIQHPGIGSRSGTTEDFAALKLKKSKMTKSERSKFELEHVDLKGFAKETSEKSREVDRSDYEDSASSFARAAIPRRMAHERLTNLRKSDSMPQLDKASLKKADIGADMAGGDAGKATDHVLHAAKGILQGLEKLETLGDRKPRRAKDDEGRKTNLKKAPSIDGLFQTQDVEATFKLQLPEGEEAPTTTKLSLQLPNIV